MRETGRIGLVNKVVPADELEITAMELYRHPASGPTEAIGLAKKFINKSLSTDLETSLDYALQALTICHYT
jgi:2-(1,2-epoxy-1,2-dihydrophenyl)acetyl-CoA isomerase